MVSDERKESEDEEEEMEEEKEQEEEEGKIVENIEFKDPSMRKVYFIQTLSTRGHNPIISQISCSKTSYLNIKSAEKFISNWFSFY